MLIYLRLSDYLAQWFVDDQGGNRPVKLKRGSMESDILEMFLQPPPEGYVPDLPAEGSLAIELPNFRHKDTRYCFYLPDKAREALTDCIRTRFDIDMWNSLHRFSNILRRQDHLIYAFMERHNIEINDANFCAIQKRYQRKRDIYKRAIRRKKSSQK